MKLGLFCLFAVAVFAGSSLGDINNVYGFCSALMSDKSHSTEEVCPRSCQGRPGKRGSVGERGPPGLKGDRGDTGDYESFREKIRLLEDEMRRNFDLIPKMLYCSMGMRDHSIPDSSITASTEYNHQHASHLGRLDGRVIMSPTATATTYIGAWCSRSNNIGQWIQIDLGLPKYVGGVVTQGRPPNIGNSIQWIKTFKVSCGIRSTSMTTINENGSDKVFIGNKDMESKVINMFPEPMLCRFVRIFPQSWHRHICMRLELIRGECHGLF